MKRQTMINLVQKITFAPKNLSLYLKKCVAWNQARLIRFKFHFCSVSAFFVFDMFPLEKFIFSSTPNIGFHFQTKNRK